jgi:hypothetical protein
MPSLVRRPGVESLGGRAVEDVDSRHHRLSLEGSGHFPLFEEGPSHPHNRLVAPLDDTVLLRAVRRGVVALNTLIRAVRREFSRREFTTIIGAQHAQLAAALRLRSLSLAVKYHNPHVAGEVVQQDRTALIPDVRNITLTLIEREDDNMSWGNFLIYFSHNVMLI